MIHQNNKIGFENLRNRYTKTIKNNTRDLELIKAKQQHLDKLERDYNKLKESMQVVREDNRRLEKILELKKEIPKIKENERKESYFLREKAINLKRRCEQKGLLPKEGQDTEEFVNFGASKNDENSSSNYRSVNEELTDFKIQDEDPNINNDNNSEGDNLELEMRSISVKPLKLDPESPEAKKEGEKHLTLTPIVKEIK